MEPMFLRNLFCYFCLCQKKARVPNKPYRQTINDFELFRRSTDKILCWQFVRIMTLIFFSLNKCVYNPKRTKKWAQVKCTHIKMACSFCRIFAYGLIFWLWTLLSRSDFKLMKVQEKQDTFFFVQMVIFGRDRTFETHDWAIAREWVNEWKKGIESMIGMV